MKPRLGISLLLFLSLLVFHPDLFAQSPVHEQFDVDSAAVPLGNASMLETFLAINLQKPFMAQVANATGRVFVKAVVDTNGHISGVTVLRGIRPDCDREALRVMRLFNAWKPAVKGGRRVRQAITYPVTFRANPPVRYVDGQLVQHFDKDSKLTDNSQTASYQQTSQVDSVSGLPSGDLVSYEVRPNGKLREVVRLPFQRIANIPARQGETVTYTIGHKQANGNWYHCTYTVDQQGKLLGRRMNDDSEIRYDSTGIVRYTKNFSGSSAITQWHSNGQLLQIETLDKTTPQLSGINPYRLMSAWDSTGRPLIVDGKGHFSHYSLARSRGDSSQQVQFIEAGDYIEGLKHGVWVGNYSDGSYSYEESFDRGKPLGGTATINKTAKVTYGAMRQNPEFKGGQQGMYAFLGQNIVYPPEAARARIQGKVFVSFTVCTDGSLCDYELMKGVDSSLDKEAMRVVRKMNGQWKPGYQRGEPVRVKYNLPISFQFQ